MKKYNLLIILVFIINSVIGQVAPVKYHKALREYLYVSYNSSLFLAGEKMHYTVFSIRDRTSKLSNLSRVAYVYLIDKNNKKIIQQKIRLLEGVGNGTFYFSKELPTGHYKLLAFTQWMRNEGDDYYFKGDVIVVNLYQKDQLHQLYASDTLPENKTKNFIIQKTKITSKEILSNGNISIELKKKKYKTRTKVNSIITSGNNPKFWGNYAISVRKKDHLTMPTKPSIIHYKEIYPQKKIVVEGKIAEFLPEFKGSLLQGKVIDKKTLQPIKNTKVVLSIPNNKYKFRFAITNDKGVFTYVFKVPNVDKGGVIQIVDKQKENYQLKMIQPREFLPKETGFYNVKIHPNAAEVLLERHWKNQIEEAYAKVKNDSISIDNYLDKEMLTKTTTYFLDDYHRFATLKETVVEVIKHVWISKKKGNYIFHVRNDDAWDEEKNLPLVIIDGVFIQNYNDIVDFDASQIKSISVVRSKFHYDDYVFQGIVFIETFDKNYKKNSYSSYLKNIKIDVPSKGEVINRQYIKTNDLSKIPDYRVQLMWNPQFKTTYSISPFSFFTSDVTGFFEIVIEGFNNTEVPVLLKTYFTVE